MIQCSKNSLFIFFFVLFLAVSGVAAPGQETEKKADERVFKNISPEEAYKRLEKNRDNPDVTILDVRTTDEYRSGHLANAVNIDYYADNFRDALDALNKERTYVINCGSGNRSGRTLAIMAVLGFQEVYNVTGGITKWRELNYPVTK